MTQARASAWGKAWGMAWGNSWGRVRVPPVVAQPEWASGWHSYPRRSDPAPALPRVRTRRQREHEDILLF